MNTNFKLKNRNNLFRIFASSWAVLIVACFSTNAPAQTYLWHQNADGREFQHCINLNAQYWPSNNYWSQSLQLNVDCSGVNLTTSQPSNWEPQPPVGVYPNGPGVDVLLAGPGTTLCDLPVTINSLTISNNGALSITSAGGVTANTIDIQIDGTIGNVSTSGGDDYVNIAAGGTLTKSGGAGTLDFGDPALPYVALYGSNYSIIVKSGTLDLPYGGRGDLYNGTFSISNNATLVVTPDATSRRVISGNLSGTGGGKVIFNNGSIWVGGYDLVGTYHDGLILNFPGSMFQWSGGNFQSGVGLTNINTINVSSNSATIYAIPLHNYGIVNLATNSSLGLVGGEIDNEIGGIFDIQGDSDITGGGVLFYNYGLLKKSSGTGTATIVPRFNNRGGSVEVDSGTLALNTAGSGGYISNATFIVHPGGTLSLGSGAIYSTEIEGMLTGSGGGAVSLSAGTLFSYYGATLNFPGGMFQWMGGDLGGNGQVLTNVGTINVSGSVRMLGLFIENKGTMLQTGAGNIGQRTGIFDNLAGGTYEIQNDLGVSVSSFNNGGLLRKTTGVGTSAIGGIFHNLGSIVASSGTLLFTTNFFQDAGTLQLTPAIAFATNQAFKLTGGSVTGVGILGGPGASSSVVASGGVLAPGNPFGALVVPGGGGASLQSGSGFNVVLGDTNQFGQLIVSNAISLGGKLTVILTNGFTPAIGTKIKIISSPNIFGSFTSLNVPTGISVSYSNTSGVYLTVTGSVPAQLQSPQLSGGNFGFSFGTVNGQSYTIQQNTNPATTNWTFYTNLTGNGSPYQFTAPSATIPQRFFRVRQP